MKNLAMAATAFSVAAALSMGAALAQGMQAAPTKNSVCLQSTQIENTTTVDTSTILFHMRNGSVWKNTLNQPCRGLALHGFVYLTHYDEICSNAEPISVIQTGETCALGTFTPYSVPQQHNSLR